MVTPLPALIDRAELLKEYKDYRHDAQGALIAAYECNNRERIIHHKARIEAFQEIIKMLEKK